MTHTLGLSYSQQETERPTRWMWQELPEDADPSRGQNLAVFITLICERELTFLRGPFVLLRFYFHVGGRSLTIRAPVLSSAQCQSIPCKRGGQSSFDSYKVAVGTVYFSWSASNERAANSIKSQLCNIATFPL